MKSLILSLFLIGSIVQAEDPVLLDAHIRMIPKIMALDTKNNFRVHNGRAILAIVYDQNKKANAQKIADTVNRLYSGKVATLSFHAQAVSVDELVERSDVSFTYLIPMNTNAVRRAALWGQNQSVPVFSYDPGNLDNGILGAIAIERATVIYLNKNVMRSGKFIFDDSLLQIARYVE